MRPISASELAQARRTGGEVAPPEQLSSDHGYALAEQVVAELGETAGWKVGATNAGGQAFLGLSEPIRGRLFRSALFQSPSRLSLPGSRACEAEPEIILEAGPDLRPARAWIGLEIVRPSRDDALQLGAGFIVADNAAHVALVTGPDIPLTALNEPSRLRVRILRNGEPAEEGSADAVLGDPRRSLAWLADKSVLRPGELVATGAMCRAARFAPGDEITADFGIHGAVEAAWLADAEVMRGPDL